MKLEQSIQRSKKSVGGIIGHTNQEELTNSAQSYSEVELPLHHELSGGFSFQFNSAINKVADYIYKRGNSFIMEGMKILRNFATGQILPPDMQKIFYMFSTMV